MTCKATYKCRYCGSTFQTGFTGERIATMIMFGFTLGQSCPDLSKQGITSTISLTEIHYANDEINIKNNTAHYGLADFIGFQVTEE